MHRWSKLHYTHAQRRTLQYIQEETAAECLRSGYVILGKGLYTHTHTLMHVSSLYEKCKYAFRSIYPFILHAVYIEISSVYHALSNIIAQTLVFQNTSVNTRLYGRLCEKACRRASPASSPYLNPQTHRVPHRVAIKSSSPKDDRTRVKRHTHCKPG